MSSAQSIVCFLVREDGERKTWRLGATMRSPLDYAKSLSKSVGAKVYAQETVYGGPELIRAIAGYLARYALGDGWFGPIERSTIQALILRIRKEGSRFLETESLP